ncbi:MAG: hypothetical protein ACLGHN_03585 [Bacteriovoracia bacterium]
MKIKNVISFEAKTVFKSDDPLSQFVIVLTQIHSNLSLSQNFLSAYSKSDELKEIHPDSSIYFLAMLLSHTRESLNTINRWVKECHEVKDFIERNKLSDLLEIIIMDEKQWTAPFRLDDLA